MKCLYNKLKVLELQQANCQRICSCWLDIFALGKVIAGLLKLIQIFVTARSTSPLQLLNMPAESLNCYEEANLSVVLEKPIIHLLMEENTWPPKNMGTLIGHLQYISFKSTSTSPEQLWSVENFDQLLERSKFYIGRPALSPNSPAGAQGNFDLKFLIKLIG